MDPTPLIIHKDESISSAVSWSAVFAGSAVAAALALVLLALGAGFGLSVISPWTDRGISKGTLSTLTIAWIVVIQIVASGMGGFLAGRLRMRWLRLHRDEVHFRDTVHGFLSWAIATIVTAACLASAVASIAGGMEARTRDRVEAVSPEAQYFVDVLFRPTGAQTMTAAEPTRAEAGRVLTAVLMGTDDRRTSDEDYLQQLVATHVGLNASDSQRRVQDVLTTARAELDAARKTAARTSLWSFLALLIGAFCASLAATYGGRERDRVVNL